jgi:hypothetical protein
MADSGTAEHLVAVLEQERKPASAGLGTHPVDAAL